MHYKCEYCDSEHEGKYGSGRFCDIKCSKAFCTKNKRIVNQTKRKLDLENKRASYKQNVDNFSILKLSKRTISKVLRRMKLPCSYCDWFVEDVSCDLHHIVSRKDGGTDANDNLSYLCPNCHRLVHSFKIDSKDLISFHDLVGDEWKQFYFTK